MTMNFSKLNKVKYIVYKALYSKLYKLILKSRRFHKTREVIL